jgi:hypothetical protein
MRPVRAVGMPAPHDRVSLRARWPCHEAHRRRGIAHEGVAADK